SRFHVARAICGLRRLFVGGRRYDLEVQTRGLKHTPTRAAGGRQDQAHAAAPRYSASRFSTAAAVSSMERRETSMVGQLFFSNSFCASITSRRTSSSSV